MKVFIREIVLVFSTAILGEILASNENSAADLMGSFLGQSFDLEDAFSIVTRVKRQSIESGGGVDLSECNGITFPRGASILSLRVAFVDTGVTRSQWKKCASKMAIVVTKSARRCCPSCRSQAQLLCSLKKGPRRPQPRYTWHDIRRVLWDFWVQNVELRTSARTSSS